MSIWAKAGANYKPAPTGTHAAVCVDVVDLGEIKVEYQGKAKVQHKIKIVWQIEELRDDGEPFRLQKRYTLSLHEKASLRKDLESWRGKQFSDEELNGFDVEVLLSKGCLVNVIHRQSEGSTFANVSAIMKLPKGMTAPTIRNYVRECDRQPAEAAPQMGPEDGYPPLDDDSVPFSRRPHGRGRQVTDETMLQMWQNQAA